MNIKEELTSRVLALINCHFMYLFQCCGPFVVKKALDAP